MRLTELVDQIEPGLYRCGVCQWGCQLAPGQVGRCQVRVGTPAGIEVLNDGMISAAQFGAIEEYRLWHFFPSTQVLAIGGWGYAFPADQQRGQYGELPVEHGTRAIPPLFIVVLTAWLAILFTSFGLFGKPNATVIGSLVLSAFAVSGAMFLILELDLPFQGIVQIPSDALKQVWADLGT